MKFETSPAGPFGGQDEPCKWLDTQMNMALERVGGRTQGLSRCLIMEAGSFCPEGLFDRRFAYSHLCETQMWYLDRISCRKADENSLIYA